MYSEREHYTMIMKHHSMTRYVYRTILAVGMIVLLMISTLFFEILYRDVEQQIFNELKKEALLIAQGIDLWGGEYVRNISTTNRITWVDGDGTVLYDSVADSSEMENHASREEIAEAYSYGEGKAIRYSKTTTERTLYYAFKNKDESVIRISGSYNNMISLVLKIAKPLLLIIGLVVFISALLASRLAKQIIKPINLINLDSPDKSDVYIEIEPLIEKIIMQKKTIQEQILQLELKQKEIILNAEIEKKELTDKVMRDSMTKLYNKESAVKKIEKYLYNGGREGKHALLFVDIDNFKSINDKYGHKEGDRIIILFAEIMKRTFKKGDIIGRFGGDEFLVFVKNYGAVIELEGLVKEFMTEVNNSFEDKLYTSVSIGIARYPENGMIYDELVKNADLAMYEAKSEGKNRYKMIYNA